MRFRVAWTVSIILVAIFGLYVYASHFITIKYMIDISSGRTKTVWKAFPFYTRAEIQDTVVSQTLRDDNFIPDTENWKIDSEFTFINRRYSPHYHYHGAINELTNIANSFDFYKIDEANRKIFSRAMIRWWNSEDYSSRASDSPFWDMEHYVLSDKSSNSAFRNISEKANHYIAEKYGDLASEKNNDHSD